jgi:membrane protease YdiL (CAAX protease family)
VNVKNKKRTLLVSSFILLPFVFVLFQVTSRTLEPKWGFITGFLGYWSYCLLTAWLISGSDVNYLKGMWNQQLENKHAKLIGFILAIVVIACFFIGFVPDVAKLTVSTGILVIIMAVLNAPIEELYWRGLYLLEYRDDTRIGFILSMLLFGTWHFSLWFAKGMIYQEGIFVVVGVPYMLGLLWTWVARSNGNIRATVLTHILVNIFAFTSLFVDNSF